MSDILAPSSLAVTQAVGLFSAFLPKLTDVRRANANDPEWAADVRLGEFAALGMLAGIGITMASITGNNLPLIISILMGIFLTIIYEYALHASPIGVERVL